MSNELLKFGGLAGSSLPYFISKHFDAGIIVLPHGSGAHLPNLQEFQAALQFFSPESEVLIYPAFESGYDAVREDPQIGFARIKTAIQIARAPKKKRFLISNRIGLLQKTIPADALLKNLLHLRRGGWQERHELITQIQTLGYIRDELAEDRGVFSVRGHLVDIFSPHHELPWRVEFFGDEIVSVRHFDPDSQRSFEELESIEIPPCRELLLRPDSLSEFKKNLKDLGDLKNIPREERESVLLELENHRELIESRVLLPALFRPLQNILSYFQISLPQIHINPEAALEEAERFWKREDADYLELRRLAYSPEHLRSRPDEVFYPSSHLLWSELKPDQKNYQSLSLQDLRSKVLSAKGLEPLHRLVEDLHERNYEIHLVCENKKRESALRESLSGLNYLHWHEGPLFTGFESKTFQKAYINERDIFGTRSTLKSIHKRVSAKDYLREFSDLQDGDYIVHEDHGIGRYRGLVTLEISGVTSEFALLEYAESDKLYLPIYRLDQISRYLSGDSLSAPKLDRLGSQVFQKKRARAREDILAVAHELLEVAAKRKSIEMERPKIDLNAYERFCSDFPYELTPDQDSTVADIESDLRKSMPMDRLVCGDVGFGKTEIALRAAMIRVLQGCQVAILAPTTLLVEQHFKGFKKRFAGHKIEVCRLSRFMSDREQKKTLEDIAQGKARIIIGTHRLLQNDIEFNKLGLLIIDEEQRFGVKHKERIKKIRAAMDVLTLSATPIPRTLQMAIAGIRDLSLITTPPEAREAVQTYVGLFDEKLIRDAALRELQRSGQILFVHNRVQSIQKVHDQIKKILPEFRIAIGHGQMDEEQLEKVMSDFIEHKYDILLATSIIENGLDIPNANTVFVDHSEQFGLSDLYQIRGRVGRGHRRAYSYFLIRENTALTPEASKRLQVIQTCTELGSGFKVASHDLEIRGSGNILGEAQSGIISEIGLELYNEMLHECLAEIKHQEAREPLPEMTSGYTAYIPEAYIPDPAVRISTYRKLNSIQNSQELLDFESELLDRFGLYSEEVDHLCQLAHIRCLAGRLSAKSVECRPGKMILELSPKTPLDPVPLMKAFKNSLQIDTRGRLVFPFQSAVTDPALLKDSKFKTAAQFDFFLCRDFLKKLHDFVGAAAA